MTTIVKATTKGQITLPAAWRRLFNTDRYIVTERDNKLEIKPLEIDRVEEYTVFDAIRDNKGKGVDAEDMLKILKKIHE